jgi:ADP-ribose pyrophosphatase YjhB (NUDIX family)
MKFYKIRAFTLARVILFLSKVLRVEVPPVVSVAALINRNGKLLFLDLSYLKGFGLPGGVVQTNEDIESSLRREIFEETGLKITKQTYLWSLPSISFSIPMLTLYYEVEVEGEEKKSVEGTLHWMEPREALGKMAYKGADVGLQKYISGK